MNQIQMVCLEDLVAKDHPYRKLKKLLDFKRIIEGVPNSVEIERRQRREGLIYLS